MSLLKRCVTERVKQANRANARRSTGPRTPAGKARSRLNVLKHGRRSALATAYFRLWFIAWMTGPWEPRRLDVAKMPVPFYVSPGHEPSRGEALRELLHEVAPYLASRPRAIGRKTLEKEFFSLTNEAVK